VTTPLERRVVDDHPTVPTSDARHTAAGALGTPGENCRRAVEHGAAAAQGREHVVLELEPLESVPIVHMETANTGSGRVDLDGHK